MSKSNLGIVSPCSTCNNQRYVADPNGRSNVCPRRAITYRVLQEMQGDAQDQTDAASYQQLTITGTDDSPSITASLSNPVYDTNGQSVMVWVALLRDNPATIYQGQVLNPPLTNPSFDTNYITCKALPFTPNSDEYGYFMKGALKEGESVIVHESDSQYTADGTQLIHIAGSVDRASYMGSLTQNPVLDDNSPEGA